MKKKPLTKKEAFETLKRQRERKNEFAKKTYKSMSLFLNKETDKDVIEKLASVPNQKGYIVGLIRKDMAENG